MGEKWSDPSSSFLVEDHIIGISPRAKGSARSRCGETLDPLGWLQRGIHRLTLAKCSSGQFLARFPSRNPAPRRESQNSVPGCLMGFVYYLNLRLQTVVAPPARDCVFAILSRAVRFTRYLTSLSLFREPGAWIQDNYRRDKTVTKHVVPYNQPANGSTRFQFSRRCSRRCPRPAARGSVH